ncbi:M24 family metallopeptidase [Sporosarcina ureilytica]|uniref:Xaa-Pro dipeptidase n=1 Tax=Sporosarcina ureilytica TaxID=298596 RepID=A0A1D8JIP9_9BACL|nr:Xaa-Pro peptidase family protein [Sporosarcina ureilytica]AOV08576.1 hypothetical protein BI350_14235 [Sporosarcina ureilytica]
MQKIVELRQAIKELEVDGILITNPLNRRYLTNFTGSAGVALITKDRAYFLTDFRYAKQAEEQIDHYEIVIYQSSRDMMQNVLGQIRDLGIQKLGFESEDVSFNFYTQLKKLDSIELVPTIKVVEKLRLIKTDEEVAKIRKAAVISDQAFGFIQQVIRPGVTEKKVANELEHFMKEQGAGGESFAIIVASGVRGALPHGVASEKVIEQGDMVTLDFGALYDGYCSDITRTLAVGEPDSKLLDIYQIVHQALELTLENIQVGMTGKEVDSIARDYIAGQGYGDYFGHGLGHGIGLNIHEDPFFSQSGEDILQAGMVITIEPGIYIPELGGVRIEDDVLIKEDGIEILTHSPKELIRL